MLQPDLCQRIKHGEEGDVDEGKDGEVFSRLRARGLGVELEGDEAGHGGNDGAQAAQILYRTAKHLEEQKIDTVV